MVDCTSTTAVNGSNFRLYVDANLTGSPSWTVVGGETTSDISVDTDSADGSNKDTSGGMDIPTGYKWSMSCEAAYDRADTGQELVRAASIAKVTRRVAWRPSGDTTGYYGWASFSWKGTGPDRDVAKFSFDVKGCGDIVDAS